MSESLLIKLDRLEKEIKELKIQVATNKKPAQKEVIDFKGEIEKVVTEEFITKLYRN